MWVCWEYLQFFSVCKMQVFHGSCRKLFSSNNFQLQLFQALSEFWWKLIFNIILSIFWSYHAGISLLWTKFVVWSLLEHKRISKPAHFFKLSKPFSRYGNSKSRYIWNSDKSFLNNMAIICNNIKIWRNRNKIQHYPQK